MANSKRDWGRRLDQAKHEPQGPKGDFLSMESHEIRARNDKIMKLRITKPRKWIAAKLNMSMDALNKVIERRLSEEAEESVWKATRFGQNRIREEMYDRWIKYTDMSYLSFEEAGGCYVVYSNGKPIYVGQSSNVSKRIGSHRIWQSRSDGLFYTPWGDKPKVYIKVKYHKRYGAWLECEARLIKRIKPKFNFRRNQFCH